MLRWATRSPPHQSPPVTASPQGEASGLCSPTRKSVPNQGAYMGPVTAPLPEQCGTTAKTSERQQAGHRTGGPGAEPRPSFSPFLGRNGDPRRAGGAPGALRPKVASEAPPPEGTQHRAAPGRWSGFGLAQVGTCEVGSRPVPGGGSRLSLRESPDAKSRGGGPPPPLGLGAARWHSLVLAIVVPDPFEELFPPKS